VKMVILINTLTLKNEDSKYNEQLDTAQKPATVPVTLLEDEKRTESKEIGDRLKFIAQVLDRDREVSELQKKQQAEMNKLIERNQPASRPSPAKIVQTDDKKQDEPIESDGVITRITKFFGR
jgi:ABC-type hemin transport system substrate-binding protein